MLVPNKISAIFDRIKTVNKPAKVTQQWLLSNGFTSKNDRALVGLLKSLGYLDGSGQPTDVYSELKGSEDARQSSIGRQMAVAYREIFDHFPTEHIANSLTRDELTNFIRPKVGAGASVVRNVVSTFFALRSLAKFDGAAPIPASGPSAVPSASISAARPSAAPAGEAFNVTINLSLEIPPTADADVYDKLFASMAKHLRDLIGRES